MKYKNMLKIKNELCNSIKFVSIAEPGAMGDPGAIELFCRINGENILFSGNQSYGKKIVDLKKLSMDFPDFSYMYQFIFQDNCELKNWEYFDLRFGNNLFVNKEIFPYYKHLTSSMSRAEMYASLYDYAFTILTLLDKVYKSEKEFIKCFYESISKENILYATVNINDVINLKNQRGFI